MTPPHQPLHSGATAEVMAGFVQSVDVGELTAMTLMTQSGPRSMLLHLASSDAGRVLMGTVIEGWMRSRTPVALVKRNGRTTLTGGSAQINAPVLALI